MQEREPLNIATIAAETMVNLWELEQSQTGQINLDNMMRHPKDLSAYSLTHAEILEQREGVELLALGMFLVPVAIQLTTKTSPDCTSLPLKPSTTKANLNK